MVLDLLKAFPLVFRETAASFVVLIQCRMRFHLHELATDSNVVFNCLNSLNIKYVLLLAFIIKDGPDVSKYRIRAIKFLSNCV